ncbi:MAG: ATP-binding protein, partial [Cyanobacteria bacterium P01_E01_bin.43]
RPEIHIIKEYSELPPLECYPSQLNQVFMNLLSNAVDALEQELLAGDRVNKPEAAMVKIITTKLNNQVLIRIRDNGPGIDEQHRAKLFDPFFTTKPIGKGTGLGLSISHQIVTDKHGGQLTVSSELGQGSEFQIYVPLHTS